jgi:hypothetical protein
MRKRHRFIPPDKVLAEELRRAGLVANDKDGGGEHGGVI